MAASRGGSQSPSYRIGPSGVDSVHHKCYTRIAREGAPMPARNPRVAVVLEKPLYEQVRRLAERDQISLSLKMRDLVREALEIEEDVALSQLAARREKTFKRSSALTHREVWG